jgi:hypothetical protein
MVNSQVIAEIIDALKLDVNVDKIPSPIPVIEVGMKQTKRGFAIVGNQTTTGTLSISFSSVSHSDDQVYITGVTLSVSKDASCDVATGQILVYIYSADTGQIMNLTGMGILTLTAQTSQHNVIFTHPIKMKKGQTIAASGTFTAGSMTRTVAVSGYVDTVN